MGRIYKEIIFCIVRSVNGLFIPYIYTEFPPL